MYKIKNNVEYDSMEHISIDTRIKIKTKLKREVWTKSFSNSMIGSCNICREEIDYDNFHCGHIESVFYGGETNKSNLLAICSKCNLNMGIKNLDEYKKELHKELL